MARKWAHLKEGEILRFSTQKHSRVAYQSFEHGGQIFEKFPKNRKKRATGRNTALFDYSFRFWIFRLFRFFGRKNRFFDFLEISKKNFQNFKKKFFRPKIGPKSKSWSKIFKKLKFQESGFRAILSPRGRGIALFVFFGHFFGDFGPSARNFPTQLENVFFGKNAKFRPLSNAPNFGSI